MANHAFAKTGKTLNLLEVDSNVRKIVSEKLHGLFKVEYTAKEKYWLLSYKDNDDFSFEFWISDDYEYVNPGIDYPNPGWDKKKILSKGSVIEFRHGHYFRFMWYVEGVIRENIGAIYNAKMYDEGAEIDPTPDPKRFETFETFCRSNGNAKLKKTHYFSSVKKQIPGELIRKLNLDFKI